MADIMERLQLRADLLAGKIPKRVPMYHSFTFEAACGLAGVDLKRAHYDMGLREKAYRAVCETFFCDTMPAMDLRYPAPYQILGAKNWILGSNGAVQHPEIETMRADEYDEFTAAPYTTIVEKFLPRVCSSLDTDAPERARVMATAYAAYNKWNAEQFGLIGKLSAEFGYGPGIIAGALIEAPFDFLADQLRGFKGITMDVRRCPDKVKAAVEAVLPLMVKRGNPSNKFPGMVDFIPLHLAPYINMKQFETLYWPTLEQLVVELDKLGIPCALFAEEDWTRYADFLARLPESSIVFFEYGDYKVFKEVVGKNHVIGGFYDPTITLTRSKEDCIDAAKRLCDTCMPGGRFYFGFDKGVIDINSVDVKKLAAVLDWVHENAVY